MIHSSVQEFLKNRPTEGPELLKEAMNATQTTKIEILLSSHFQSVAQGSYEWLTTLRENGLNVAEIIEVLVETAKCKPWVRYPNLEIEVPETQAMSPFHQNCCAHQLRHEEVCYNATNAIDRSESLDQAALQRRVSLFCGIAGVFPPGSWARNQYGSLDLSSDQALVVSFAGIDPSEVVSQLCVAIHGAMFALATLQEHGFCCDRFTLLSLRLQALPAGAIPVMVHMNTIAIEEVAKLRDSIKLLEKEGLSEPALFVLLSICVPLLERLFDISLPTPSTVLEKLHIYSLTVQSLCLGILFYAHGHSGILHPDYLAEALHTVKLQGCSSELPSIVSTQRQLACLGEMVGSNVSVFSTLPQSVATEESLYLSASCEDIVDSWGPGTLIMNSEGPPLEDKVLGLVIRGGIITADRTLANGDHVLHWEDADSRRTESSSAFGYRERILVGSTAVGLTAINEKVQSEHQGAFGAKTTSDGNVTSILAKKALPHLPFKEVRETEEAYKSVRINGSCPRDANASRAASQPFLADMATSSGYWKFIERSVMLQFGNNVLAQVGGTQVKQPGVPLKRAFLDRWTNDGKLSQFEEPWGLQVSLCTGVARRVPIRALLRDDLMGYIHSLRIDGWSELQAAATAAMISTENFRAWSETLTLPELKCMQTVFSKTLTCLKDTGFDKTGLSFAILWPNDSDARFCVKVPSEGDHEWCEMLKDTAWSATFAVATNRCIEAGSSHKCRQAKAAEWCGAKVLVTSMLPSLFGISPSTVKQLPGTQWQIEHDKRYWNGGVGQKVQFRAEKENTAAIARLGIERNKLQGMPKRFWSMLPIREVLVERSDMYFKSEEVVIIP